MTDNSNSVLYLRRCGLIPVEYGKTPQLDARLLGQNIAVGDTQVPEAFGASLVNGESPPDVAGETPIFPLRLQ